MNLRVARATTSARTGVLRQTEGEQPGTRLAQLSDSLTSAYPGHESLSASTASIRDARRAGR